MSDATACFFLRLGGIVARENLKMGISDGGFTLFISVRLLLPTPYNDTALPRTPPAKIMLKECC